MARRDEAFKEPMFDTTNAACADADPTYFFPEGKNFHNLTFVAKMYCSECPLVEECLNYAIRNDEWGVWGGATRVERNYLRGKPRGRKKFLDLLVLKKGRATATMLEDENNILGIED